MGGSILADIAIDKGRADDLVAIVYVFVFTLVNFLSVSICVHLWLNFFIRGRLATCRVLRRHGFYAVYPG